MAVEQAKTTQLGMNIVRIHNDHVPRHFQTGLLAAERHDIGHGSGFGLFDEQVDDGKIFTRGLEQRYMRAGIVYPAIPGIPAHLAPIDPACEGKTHGKFAG